MRKSLWSPDEDEKLRRYVAKHGCGNWSDVAKQTGLHRCGKSCRLRWINYLRPDLKRGPFSAHEVRLVVNLHSTMGNSWSKIATHLPGRTDNDVKNFWHSYTRSRRTQQYYANSSHANNDANIKSNDQKLCRSHEQYHDSAMHKSMMEQEHIINKGHDYERLMQMHHVSQLPTNTININIKGLAANCMENSSKSVNNAPQIHPSRCKPSDPSTTLNALSHTHMQHTISLHQPNHMQVSHNCQPDTHLLRSQEANSINPFITSDTKPLSIANLQPHDAAGAPISTFYKGFQPPSCSKGSLTSFQHFPPLIEACDHINMVNAIPSSHANHEINCTINPQSAGNNSNSRISYLIPHEESQNPHAFVGDYPTLASFNSARSLPASYAAVKEKEPATYEAAENKPPEGLESVIWRYRGYPKGQPEAADASDHYNKPQYITPNHPQLYHNQIIKTQLSAPNYLLSDHLQSPHELIPSDQSFHVEAFSNDTSPRNLQYLQAQFLADCLS